MNKNIVYVLIEDPTRWENRSDGPMPPWAHQYSHGRFVGGRSILFRLDTFGRWICTHNPLVASTEACAELQRLLDDSICREMSAEELVHHTI